MPSGIFKRKQRGKYIKCDICGKEFYIFPFQIKKNTAKYCSHKCFEVAIKQGKYPQNGFQKGHKGFRTLESYQNEDYKRKMGNKSDKWYDAMKEKMSGENNPSFKGGLIKKECLYCGKEFFVYPYRDKEVKYCSRKCRGLCPKYRELISGENNYNWKNGLPRCIKCNKILSAYHTKHGLCKKCSSILYQEEKCNFWKGGITSINARIRSCYKYRDWRKAVYERDNFTCQECGQRGKRLHAHHKLVSFSKIINCLKEWVGIEKLYESAMKFEPLWDLDNGQTLCLKCHKKTDDYLKNYSKTLN